ncbi:hypothetical protein F511_38841 [Dorcoceras hygrometricum]|uniref:Uncharacterized protein n=1 Tax=Dorcoceras hygrometricum TaxID=472368 RepID=A0A2Z7BL32_9LAMI|nr:hypothetical protein F511_38841 [Dorcoceras hygrometricum]
MCDTIMYRQSLKNEQTEPFVGPMIQPRCVHDYVPPVAKNEETEPFVWSNDPAQVANLIESHIMSMLDGECSRSRTYDMSWFYEDQTRKIQAEINKVKGTTQQLKYPNCEEEYGCLSSEELRRVENRKSFQVPDSSFSMNPQIDPLPPYFDAQSYLKNQQRMLMMIHYQNYNVMNYAPPMSFGMQNVGDFFLGYGEDLLATMADPDPEKRQWQIRIPFLGAQRKLKFCPEKRPRPETRVFRQSALEGLTNLARTESPQHDDRNKSDHGGAWEADGGVRFLGEEGAATILEARLWCVILLALDQV